MAEKLDVKKKVISALDIIRSMKTQFKIGTIFPSFRSPEKNNMNKTVRNRRVFLG